MSGATSKNTLWATVKAVAWSFLGVRRNRDFQDDIARLKPYHIIGVGLAAGVLFVLTLILLVRWIAA